jgi:hypothetical protein
MEQDASNRVPHATGSLDPLKPNNGRFNASNKRQGKKRQWFDACFEDIRKNQGTSRRCRTSKIILIRPRVDDVHRPCFNPREIDVP